MKFVEMIDSRPLVAPYSADPVRHEVKYLIDEAQAQRVLAWAGEHLTLDSHADPSLGGTYSIMSLYLDNDERDVYYRRGSHKHSRYRLRRYGTERFVFLERKSKWGSRVKKRRTLIGEPELSLLESDGCPQEWLGSWFRRRILSQQLKPAYQVSYKRAAYVGISFERPIRLTMDRKIRCSRAASWALAETEGLALLTGHAILELKYRGLVPAPFKSFIHELDLTSTSISKYRLAVRAWEAVVANRAQ